MFQNLGEICGRHSRKSTVNIVMKDRQMRKLVAVKMGKFVKKELQETCSNKAESKFKDKSLDALTSFSWNETLIDLERTAPVFTLQLHNIIGTELSTKSQGLHK